LGSRELAIFFGSTPMLLDALPISNNFMQGMVNHPDKGAVYLGFLSAYVLGYAALAWLLYRSATRRFDVVAGRAAM
jgi:hypothetical protein